MFTQGKFRLGICVALSLALHAFMGLQMAPGVIRERHGAAPHALTSRLSVRVDPPAMQRSALAPAVPVGAQQAPSVAPLSVAAAQTGPALDARLPEIETQFKLYFPPDKLTRQPEILNPLDFDRALGDAAPPAPALKATLYLDARGHIEQVAFSPALPDGPAKAALTDYLSEQNILPGEITRVPVPAYLELEIRFVPLPSGPTQDAQTRPPPQ